MHAGQNCITPLLPPNPFLQQLQTSTMVCAKCKQSLPIGSTINIFYSQTNSYVLTVPVVAVSTPT